jgi:hypothetical protein
MVDFKHLTAIIFPAHYVFKHTFASHEFVSRNYQVKHIVWRLAMNSLHVKVRQPEAWRFILH